MDDAGDVDFGESGLVPAVAQDVETGEVLMVAYVSPEALARTRETGRAHYYSRSRDELWEKGATSGHVQSVAEIRVDCDADTLLYLVEQEGGACHTGHRSCFYRTIEGETVGERVFDPETVYELAGSLEGETTGEGGRIERLEATRRRHAEAEDRIDEHGEETVRTVANAYRRATGLLDEYEGRAAGTGKETFKAYVELEGEFESLLDELPEDLPRRGAFEDANDAIDKRRLNEADFERAREAVEPASEFVDLREEREAAAEARESARIELRERLDELDGEIERREDLLELGSADLEAPVERLRDPIDRYNAAVEDAFQQYRRETPARELFDLVERSRLYPLVSFERPPEALRRYVEETPAGTEPVSTLLEYAGYSRSKLAHYVEDADALKRRVATERTYLEGIDAEPLTVAWPPEPAGVVSRRARELRPFVERVGGEEEVAALRAVRAATRDQEYGRLRRAAVAADRLSETERERLADGRVEAELAELRAERDRLADAL